MIASAESKHRLLATFHNASLTPLLLCEVKYVHRDKPLQAASLSTVYIMHIPVNKVFVDAWAAESRKRLSARISRVRLCTHPSQVTTSITSLTLAIVELVLAICPGPIITAEAQCHAGQQ